MTKTIWKYQLDLTDEQVLNVPAGAEFLSVQEQGIDICLWALVNPGNEVQPRLIFIVGTGNSMPDFPVRHIDTVQTDRYSTDSLVWHVFEEKA